MLLLDNQVSKIKVINQNEIIEHNALEDKLKSNSLYNYTNHCYINNNIIENSDYSNNIQRIISEEEGEDENISISNSSSNNSQEEQSIDDSSTKDKFEYLKRDLKNILREVSYETVVKGVRKLPLSCV